MTDAGPLESDTCRDYVVPRLESAGWKDQFIEQYPITDGRIIPKGRGYRRGKPLRADYVLEVEPSFSIAVVEAKRLYKIPGQGLQQAKNYAELLDLPFAYSTNGQGIVEHDYDTGVESNLNEFPTPDELWERYRAWKGLTDPIADVIRFPFDRTLRNPDGSVKEPRYYQRVAIERSLQAIMEGRDRVLLTMATGTGKTFTAMQILWKLWRSDWQADRKPRFLYLADRNILVDQPIAREFQPIFGDAIWKVSGELKTGRELYFALYQALADTGDTLGIFRDYPSDYFDLIVVDEAHRGSARDDSSWREILEHFSDATQLGMIATPKRDDNIDTYSYFGNPVYQYSLARGIDDGFLAPYRVRRVVLSADAMGWSPDLGELDRFGREIPRGVYETPHFERVVSLLTRTEAAAKHLTLYLRKTDPMAKTIVFCVDSEHADQMRQALNNANADLARQHPDYVARIVSDEGTVGKNHLDNFADPHSPTPVIATTSKLLSTGVDLQTVKNIVLFRPIGSIVEFKQIIGRGTRLYPDEDKLTFEIIDYSGATALFEDPEFDGSPDALITEQVNTEGEVEDTTEVAKPDPEYGPEETAEIQAEDIEYRARKYYVDDGEVYVVVEGFYLADPTTGRLRLVEYADYVAEQVRRLFPQASDLRASCHHRAGRADVREALAKRGIAFDELAERTGLTEADPFDVLVHVAWNAPVLSRYDRVHRLRLEHADFFAQVASEARAVLDDLLDKYAEHGITQLDDLRVLDVPPFPERYGNVIDIASRFGGKDRLHETIAQLEELLYTA